MAAETELGGAPGLETAPSAASESATPAATALEDQQEGICAVSRLTGDILKVEGSIPPPVKGANR
jgi:hypothetical protein